MPRGKINVCRDVYYKRIERSNSEECLQSGEKYFGSASQTVNGETCLPWNTPGLRQLFEGQNTWSHNYCRNNGGIDDTPICLVDETTYDECDVPNCESDRVKKTICSVVDQNLHQDFHQDFHQNFHQNVVDTRDPDCDKVHDFPCKNQCIDINHACDGHSHCSDGSDESRELCSRPFDIKLVGGSNEKIGWVAIRHRGIWGTICDDRFGDNEAKVVCRMLGFPTDNATVLNTFIDHHNEGPIWITLKEEDGCTGNEYHLGQCKQSYLWEHDYSCNHSEDAVVTCQ